MFGAIGTIFLWMFWPSFNGCLATGNSQHRVVINTVLAIASSCIGSFAISGMLNDGLYKMEDAMNASLAGGVMIGSSSDLVAASWVSILVGLMAGVISTLAFNKFWGWAYEKLGLHDTCGVNNLHGLPGIVGAIIGAISCGAASETVYGDNLTDIFTELGKGRSQASQAGYQMACLGSTVFIGVLGGLLTGLIIRAECFAPLKAEDCFEDEVCWHMSKEEEVFDKKLERAKIM